MDTAIRTYELQNVERQLPGVKGSQKNASPSTLTTAIRNVAELFARVNIKMLLSMPNPVAKYLLNSDGTPKVAYHATYDSFTAFDRGRTENHVRKYR